MSQNAIQQNYVELKGHDLDNIHLVKNVIDISCRNMVSMLDIIQLSSGYATSSGVQHVTGKDLGLQQGISNLFLFCLLGFLMITKNGILEIYRICTTFRPSRHRVFSTHHSCILADCGGTRYETPIPFLR
jgi:hypothetical protein